MPHTRTLLFVLASKLQRLFGKLESSRRVTPFFHVTGTLFCNMHTAREAGGYPNLQILVSIIKVVEVGANG